MLTSTFKQAKENIKGFPSASVHQSPGRRIQIHETFHKALAAPATVKSHLITPSSRNLAKQRAIETEVEIDKLETSLNPKFARQAREIT